ncbi:MAG: hypothetical protein A3B99_04660 [Candidatus Yanofskybacteria bacterium RIFCSPHIGHO2_02_FULL_44_12b]|uniref:DUF1573 domain-containing protein n=2 Tax=Candidatus Yanofskyibacteriota TaxID=1752733 RepID=A0A1F8GM18_9BACT|nr:MAG: hypothetical protein UW79_C0013G0069 [Candidatus Yanofskybacteria bacterium GW2011_GWA2_44_9]OGN04358.1 MAG: hypothetical protein A2659_03460 [Candidatus Yanofskybacteria bacterium RIFCSPHIGHO2_01_FULL_44_24]OGN14467.1 MAG: hypothetical protein A3B99_04660 [Candidatus Yanofskybacteria bacterium RIFCSPHIGHO2_02_FULL_44_12b]OGN25748.1 MAG: hypothetical protein A2925_01000 [Candidatus Yanofskybacteria bacterium RIFCSPLOWO2_01_FULL_44_22]
MNKKVIAGIFVGTLVLIGGLIWLAKPAPDSIGGQADTTSSLLKSDGTFFDFGTISMKDGDVTKEFIVTNPTDKDILVTTLETSCMCTKAFMVKPDGTAKGPFGMRSMGYAWPINETIVPGESRTIRVVYDPNAHGPAGVGLIDRFVILTEESGSQLQLEIKAIVKP